MFSIYELSWGRASFLAKLLLFFKSNFKTGGLMGSNVPEIRAGACSVLSSTYYSIVGTAKARLDQIIVGNVLLMVPRLIMFCFTWVLLGGWCYFQMLYFSNRVLKEIGLHGMNAEQCDVRQSILRQRGWFEEAEQCIKAGLVKDTPYPHTRGLLRVGWADLQQRRGDISGADANIAFAIGVAKDSRDKRQSARIYRQCAEVLSRINPHDKKVKFWRETAKALILETGAKDQKLKLG